MDDAVAPEWVDTWLYDHEIDPLSDEQWATDFAAACHEAARQVELAELRRKRSPARVAEAFRPVLMASAARPSAEADWELRMVELLETLWRDEGFAGAEQASRLLRGAARSAFRERFPDAPTPARSLATRDAPASLGEDRLADVLERIEGRLTALEEPPDPRRSLFRAPGARDETSHAVDEARRAAGEAPPSLGLGRAPPARRGPRDDPHAGAGVGPRDAEPSGSDAAEPVAVTVARSLERAAEALALADHASGGGARALTQLRRVRAEYRQRPASRWEHLEMVADEAGAGSVSQYFQAYTQVRRDRLSMYSATLFTGIGEALARGEVTRAQGLAASGAMFWDSYAANGMVEHAWGCTLELEPPVLRRHPETPAHSAHPGASKRSGKKQGPQRVFGSTVEEEVNAAILAAGSAQRRLAGVAAENENPAPEP
jgi:hypothetical protein